MAETSWRGYSPTPALDNLVFVRWFVDTRPLKESHDDNYLRHSSGSRRADAQRVGTAKSHRAVACARGFPGGAGKPTQRAIDPLVWLACIDVFLVGTGHRAVAHGR